MDFLKILKSLEELVFEALTWIVLLPYTLLRILRSPVVMADYAAGELRSENETRFSEAISPPLLLILCVLIAHGVDMSMHTHADNLDGTLAADLLASEQNLLLYRTIAFGIWSLAGSLYYLLRTSRPVNRETLRYPFYEQCYLVAPFALVFSIGVTLISTEQPRALLIGVLAALSAACWFWIAQIAWIRRHTSLRLWRCMVAATAISICGYVVNGLMIYALIHVHSSGR